jgi:rhodanese-related sulfurtransferase
MKISLPLIVLLSVLCLELTGQSADSVKYISLEPYDFHLTWLKTDKALLIDVREFFEYKKSRIKDAINIPSSANMEFACDTLDKELSLFLYCTSGFRSKRVAEKFGEMGFAGIFNLEGGIKAWTEEGFPVEKKRLKGTREKRCGGEGETG